MNIERAPNGQRLRVAVLGDFDGVHTRSWLAWFAERGHDVHAISYYAPSQPLDGVTLHVIRSRQRSAVGGQPSASGWFAGWLPRGVTRLVHAIRYRRAGLARVVRAISPDVLHAHFLVEHGFYGTAAGFHPYVVTAWGSDVLVEPRRDVISRRIARWTIRRADALTSNNAHMADELVALGAPRERVHVVTLGADRYFLEGRERSVNLRGAEAPPTVISTRAHEPLYNVEEIVDAFAAIATERADARLIVAHGGSRTEALRARAASLGDAVTLAGFFDRAAFREALHSAHVFVSVPSSDATSVALLQAMAAGCFPIVSDLPSQREWIEHGVNGFLVPLHRPDALASRIETALADASLRRRAAGLNARIVEERGLNETQMLRMEEIYLRLAGRDSARRHGGAEV